MNLPSLWQRLLFLVGRGRITLVDDSRNVQWVQVVLGPLETRDMRRVAEFGLASNPPEDTDAVAIFIAGDRDNGVVIGTNNQALRPKNLQPGEVMIYDATGQSVYLSKTGIVINGAGKPINVNNAPQININGAQKLVVQASVDVELDTPVLKVTGDIVDNTGSGNTKTVKNIRDAYDAPHTHEVVGVQAGSSTIVSTGPTPPI